MVFTTTLHRYQDIGLLVLRLAIAAVFIYHGTQKWGLWTATPDTMPAQMVLVLKVLSVVEPLAGLALVVGFMTEIAALALAIVMVGAIYAKMQIWQMPFASSTGTGWEFDLVLLAGSLVLLFTGAGVYSLDRSMGK